MKEIKININITDTPIHVFIGKEKEEIVKQYPNSKKSILDDDYSGIMGWWKNNDKTMNAIIYIQKWDIPVLVHEIFHFVDDWTRIYEIDDKETRAYTAGYILKTCMKKIKER